MSIAVAHLWHWVVLALLITNILVSAATVPKLGLTDAGQLADASKETVDPRLVGAQLYRNSDKDYYLLI